MPLLKIGIKAFILLKGGGYRLPGHKTAIKNPARRTLQGFIKIDGLLGGCLFIYETFCYYG